MSGVTPLDTDSRRPQPGLSSTKKVRRTWPLITVYIFTAGVVASVLGGVVLQESLSQLGIPDPGLLTTAGYPFVRASSWMLLALAVGSFLASAFLIPPDDVEQERHPHMQGVPIGVDAVIAVRTGGAALFGYALLALFMVPLTLSDVSGSPLLTTLQPEFWPIALEKVEESNAWLMSAVFSLIVAILSRFSRTWKMQPILLALSILVVLPLGLTGHSASGGDHDYGTNSLLWHLFAMLLWVGGLMAVLAYGRRLGPSIVVAVRRYSKVALVCIVCLALSGFVNAAIRVSFGDLLTTNYGRLIVAKLVLTLVLAGFGAIHRQKTIPALEKSQTEAFARFASGELICMGAIIGVATALGRTAPPPPRVQELTPMMLEMGYSLTKSPDVWNVWTVWRFDIMFGTVGLILAGMYVWGLWKLRQQGKQWKPVRTMWFMLGSLGLTLCMSSGVGLYMPAMFSMHMVTHMVISMVLPVFLVLGAPLTLAMEVLPKTPDGVRAWIDAGVHSKTLRFLMHPAVNTIQFVSIFYFLYITPWYEAMVSSHAGHLLMNWVFFLSGTLYFWEMIGPDPKPQESSVMARLAWLVFSMPFHLYFGVYLMQLTSVLAEDFYASLQLPWDVDLLYDQRVGGGIAWASGAFPLVVVFGALFLEWLQTDREDEVAYERRASLDGEEELAAYNAMLAQYARGEESSVSLYHAAQEERKSGDA